MHMMMEGSRTLSFSSLGGHFPFYLCQPPSYSRDTQNFKQPKYSHFSTKNRKSLSSSLHPHLRILSLPFALAEPSAKAPVSSLPLSATEMSAKVDKSGRFCTPRAARELALLISYAACLDGSDPVRLFDKRVNDMKYPELIFDKTSLLEYTCMSFSGPPILTETEQEAEEFLVNYERESAIDEDVLSAPPKLVYNKFVLRFARNILAAVVDRWDQHVLIIDKITPPNWKHEPAGRILELCLLHLAMAEITLLGTRHQIVINEAVDLAKRFCDGNAPRIVNGCLRTFIRDYSPTECSAVQN